MAAGIALAVVVCFEAWACSSSTDWCDYASRFTAWADRRS